MRILTCFISASAGAAKVAGFDVFDDPLEVRKRIGYLPQRAPLYGEMNVWEYLSFVAEMRGLESSVFRKRMKGIVEVCGLGGVLGKDIRTLSHGFRQRIGLGQALVHDPPILILDEPTSDLDPNEKAEVIRYIKQIGKERTILLSTHNLSEVEAACARAIIVSKGRVVADGGLDDIRSRSNRVRYIITIHEKKAFEGKKAPTAQEVQDALSAVSGATNVVELPTDDKAHAFQLSSSMNLDLREALFQLIVQKGWLLLEMRRDTQTLEDVFKTLTKGDERKDRGRPAVFDDEADDEEEEDEGDEDKGADDEEDDDEAGDDDGAEGDDEDDEDEEPADAKDAKKKS